VDLAERDAEVRGRATEVLRWLGLDAGEVILDRLRQEKRSRRASSMTCWAACRVYPMVTPLLQGHHAHEIRHGAALLGRLGRPEAVETLAPLLSHRDERVRAAAVRALGEIHRGSSAEALRDALTIPIPRPGPRPPTPSASGGVGAGTAPGRLAGDRARQRCWHAVVSALGGWALRNLRCTLNGGPYPAQLASPPGVHHRSAARGRQRARASDSAAARTTLERLAREAEGWCATQPIECARRIASAAG